MKTKVRASTKSGKRNKESATAYNERVEEKSAMQSTGVGDPSKIGVNRGRGGYTRGATQMVIKIKGLREKQFVRP